MDYHLTFIFGAGIIGFVITKTKARLIAGDNHSGPHSPLYRFYRDGIIDTYGMSLEINDALPYANPKNKKKLRMLLEYIYVIGNGRR